MISGLYATPIKTNQDQSRLDAPGALHNSIVSSIDRKRLFTDGSELLDLKPGNKGDIGRLVQALSTRTKCQGEG